MATQSKGFIKQDVVKIGCLLIALICVLAVCFTTPVLSTPTLLAVILSMLITPVLAAMERRGLSRIYAIMIVFLVIAAGLSITGVWAARTVSAEWDGFTQAAPTYFYETIERLEGFENQAKEKYPILNSLNPTNALLTWGKETGTFFITHVPQMMGDLLTWILIVPIIVFFLLKDGRAIRKKFYELVPNRYFEISFMVTSRIFSGLSDYIRAKLIEGFLVGSLTTIGLLIVDAPYAFVLGLIAGVTNIVPYVGPFIGAIPGVLIFVFDPNYAHLLWPVVAVYSIANIIDMAVIFPIFVAKLVNLHPLILIAAVILGQQYYGLIGMLVSIPIATTLKVVFQEVYAVVYDSSRSRPLPSTEIPVAEDMAS